MRYFCATVICQIAIVALTQTTALFAGGNPLATDETREKAKVLPSHYVYEMFDRFGRACAAKDDKALLDQLSLEKRQYILERKLSPQSLWESISYLCENTRSVEKEIASAPNPIFATFKKGNTVRLCFRAPNDLRCKGELRVAFEDDKLKLDDR
jgi:hypothetical protein